MTFKKATVLVFSLASLPCLGDVYFGGSVGIASNDDSSVQGDEFFTYTTIDKESSDTSDIGFSLFVGYEISRSFEAELAWADLGENTMEATGQDFSPGGEGRREALYQAEGNAFSLSVKGKGYISENVYIYAKGGLTRWRIKGSINGYVYDTSEAVSGSLRVDSSLSDTGYVLGLGLGYNDFFSAYEIYDFDGEATSYLSIGYKF